MKVRRTLLFVFALNSLVQGEEFGGIDFPQGAVSFADRLVSYDPEFSGGAVPTHEFHINPLDAIGAPDHPGGSRQEGSVSLGSGGRIILEFTNNVLTGSGDTTPDLHIFEVGTNVEATFIDISADGVTWFSVGSVAGLTSSIDIDAFGFSPSDQFSFVRLTDDPNDGNTTGVSVGADIDSVGAVSAVQVSDIPQLCVQIVPIEGDLALLLEFQTALGSVYTIEESATMADEDWSEVFTSIQGTGDIAQFFFSFSEPRMFYRIKPPE